MRDNEVFVSVIVTILQVGVIVVVHASACGGVIIGTIPEACYVSSPVNSAPQGCICLVPGSVENH